MHKIGNHARGELSQVSPFANTFSSDDIIREFHFPKHLEYLHSYTWILNQLIASTTIVLVLNPCMGMHFKMLHLDRTFNNNKHIYTATQSKTTGRARHALIAHFYLPQAPEMLAVDLGIRL